jgi:hypothetical protein
MQRFSWDIPNAQTWTRWDEFKQRVGNCRRMMLFAWLALTTDSATFHIVLVNVFRSAGDGWIAATMKNGRRIDPMGIDK